VRNCPGCPARSSIRTRHRSRPRRDLTDWMSWWCSFRDGKWIVI